MEKFKMGKLMARKIFRQRLIYYQTDLVGQIKKILDPWT